MRKIIILITIICSTAHLCAQEDSLAHIFDDVQEEESGLTNWLEILSDQLFDADISSGKSYPTISLTHRFQCTFEQNNALLHNTFIGSAHESYTRIKTKIYSNLSAGILIQKDVGEPSYFDHVSGYISWSQHSYPISIILGNYYIGCAEGLLLSGPFSLPTLALIKKQNPKRFIKSRPFLSSNECDGFWGGVLEIGSKKNWRLITFYSRISRDGIFSDEDTSIIGFERSGYHRTLSERKKIDLISERTYGGVLSVPIFYFDQLGFSFVKTVYYPKISAKQSLRDQRRNFFKFNGLKIENYSLFYQKTFQPFALSGEIVPVRSKKISHITTLNFFPSTYQIVFKLWNIPNHFQSPFGRIPSDSNPFPKSARGFMLGMSGRPLKEMTFTIYWFLKKDLWRTYFQPLPMRKKELYIQGKFSFGNKKTLSLRYNISTSNFYSSDYHGTLEKFKQSIRIQLNQKLGSHIRMQARIEKVLVNYSSYLPTKSGVNFYQDFYWQIFKSMTLQYRFSSFRTDDFDSRLYEYENDIPHVFSNYALYGKGRKWYIMITLKPIPHIKIWFKYRRFVLDDVESIGSGMNRIYGDMKQDFHLQLTFRY